MRIQSLGQSLLFHGAVGVLGIRIFAPVSDSAAASTNAFSITLTEVS
jgi:hypothetical protein